MALPLTQSVSFVPCSIGHDEMGRANHHGNCKDNVLVSVLVGGNLEEIEDVADVLVGRVSSYIDEDEVDIDEGEEVEEDQLDREWIMEDFLPQEVNLDEPWMGEEEVYANDSVDRFVDVSELSKVRKEWGKVFDPIPWPAVDESDEGDAIGGPEGLPDVDKLQVGTQFESMADFRIALSDAVIQSHFEVLKVEAKKKIYSARCENYGCPWKVRATFVDGRVKVTRYCGQHTCGHLRPGRDHTMATAEWIAHKSEGLYDDSQHITPKSLILHVNKYDGVVPSYRKCHLAKEIIVNKIEGNHDASFGILPVYGQELVCRNAGINMHMILKGLFRSLQFH